MTIFALLWGTTFLRPEHTFKQDDWLPGVKSAFQQAKTMDVSVVIREPGEPPRSARLVFARPNKFYLYDSGRIVRSNGTVIETLDSPDKVSASVASDDKSIAKAFESDFWRIWSMFIRPNCLDGFEVKNLDPEARGAELFGVMMLSQPSGGGKFLRLIIDPKDRLPREVQFSSPGRTEVTKAVVGSIKLDQEVDEALFGKPTSASELATPGSKNGSAAATWTALVEAKETLYPSRTNVVISGDFPKQLTTAGGRTAKIVLTVNGKVSTEVETGKGWKLTWVPEPGQLGECVLELQGRQSNQVVALGTARAMIRPDWPIKIAGSEIDENGSIRLDVSSSLPTGITGLMVSLNGKKGGASISGDVVVLSSTSVTPGQVNLGGSFTRLDGAEFELSPTTFILNSLLDCVISPDQKWEVTRANMEQTAKISVTSKRPFSPTKWTAWTNGFQVANGEMSSGNVNLPLEAVFEGKNDLVLELSNSKVTLFSAHIPIVAKVDVDVQRLRVSEILQRVIELPLRRSVLLLAMAQELSIDEEASAKALTDLKLPGPRKWIESSLAISEVDTITNQRPPVTTDYTFNERAKELDGVAKGILRLTCSAAAKLSIAYGDGRIVANGPNLAATISQMISALKGATSEIQMSLENLAVINKFFAEFKPRVSVSFARETSLLKQMAAGTQLRYNHQTFLENIAEILRIIDSVDGLDKLKKTVETTQDVPFRKKIQVAIDHLIYAAQFKLEMIKLMVEIRRLELAMSRASSKEEREVHAKRIAELRQAYANKEEDRKIERARAWAIIEEIATELHIDFSGVLLVAPK